MSKIAPILLLVVGLAVGLWLGLNPRTHQQIVQSWDHARAAVVHFADQIHLSPAKTTSVRLAPTAHVQAPNLSTIWKDIQTAFESLFRNLQRAWMSVTARVSSSK